MTQTITRYGDWMQTYTGKAFYPLDPRPEEVCLADIAHAESMICRYGGHCNDFYSVAEHSVHTSYLVPEEDAMHALLHDATEAYCADIIRPIKPFLEGYSDIEERLWLAIAAHFRISPTMPLSVKKADNAILLTEMGVVMGTPPRPWNIAGEAGDRKILCLPPKTAEIYFIKRFNELAQKPYFKEMMCA
jgi:hypothetical protein